jgi:hypothetical protein
MSRYEFNGFGNTGNGHALIHSGILTDYHEVVLKPDFQNSTLAQDIKDWVKMMTIGSVIFGRFSITVGGKSQFVNTPSTAIYFEYMHDASTFKLTFYEIIHEIVVRENKPVLNLSREKLIAKANKLKNISI